MHVYRIKVNSEKLIAYFLWQIQTHSVYDHLNKEKQHILTIQGMFGNFAWKVTLAIIKILAS